VPTNVKNSLVLVQHNLENHTEHTTISSRAKLIWQQLKMSHRVNQCGHT